MRKTVVLHSVAVNGGDELLFKVLEKGLYDIANTEIIAKTTNNLLSFPYLGENVFLNNSLTGDGFFNSRIPRKIYRLGQFYKYAVTRKILANLSSETGELLEMIKKADFVLLMPGGYLHEYYGFKNIAKMVDVVSNMGKPVYIFGQSLGPYESKDGIKTARKILGKTKVNILREDISAEYVNAISSSASKKTKVTTDIAFAYNKLFQRNVEDQNQDPKRVLLNFRDWKNGINFEKVFLIGDKVSTYLYEHGYHIEYISTCQGVDEYYYNDADIAKKIVTLVRKKYPAFQPTIHTKRYAPKELLSCMKGAAFYIGMRLHGAISAILSHVPALNIGYEHKSAGVYETIDLSNYTISIDSPLSTIMDSVEEFIDEPLLSRRENFSRALHIGENKALGTFKIL
jgi:polysaccharide pyruvyl transferase WcaK-like protein